MAEYIEKEAILNFIGKDGYYGEYDLAYWAHNISFQDAIRKLPAANVRENVMGSGFGPKPRKASTSNIGSAPCVANTTSIRRGFALIAALR